jgi:SNF2 family DNA or RNA helicase
MIILHGACVDERLFVWGETPNEAAAARASRRRRNGSAPQLPYDAGIEGVARALRSLPAGIGNTLKANRRREAALTAWLPSRDGQPLPSSALIGEAPASEAPITIEPWLVNGLLLDPRDSLDLLSASAGRAVHGMIPGRDFSFWGQALHVAASMVTRQRYLPGLVERDGAYFARWQPVWIGADVTRLEAMAAGMPGVARAVTDGLETPPGVPAADVIAAFIGGLVDHIARSHANDGVPSVGSVVPEAVHDRWLAALRRPGDGRVEGPPEELASLAKLVAEWRQPGDDAATAPFRLCFRLEEPTSGKEEPWRQGGRRRNGRKQKGREMPRPGQRRWYVRYLLQATDDPSLLVPTADAWITRGRKAAALSRMGTDVHEALLASLAQAAGLCPRIGESLRSRKPSGYSLDAKGAHEFLTVTAPALEQAGFGTLLPEWWTETGTAHRLCVRARVRTPERSELPEQPSLDETVDFDWEIALGGRALSGRDLEELARLKEPLVQVRGQWIETGIDEIHAALEFWKNRKAGTVTAREIVRMALGSADTSAGIRFEGVRATGWLGDLLACLEDKTAIVALPTPRGFRGELRPYQQRGYAWLEFLQEWRLGACLADDMGLGKTIQTLALALHDRERGEDRPMLLVCPTSVLTNWQREASRFAPDLPVTVHHGAARPRGYEFTQRAYEHALVLTSYALLHRDLEELSTVQWSGIVLDEAQNIKNPDTKQSQAVRNLVADFRVALTGTPVENHVGDLWSIMDFLNPGFLGSREEFKRAFFVPIQAFRDREAAERLQRLSGPFILRRLKTDRSIISDLPDKLEMKVYCALTAEQGRLYTSVVEDSEKKIRDATGIERRGVILAALTKLKQVCNHPAHFLGDGSELGERSGKLTRLTEMLEELIETGDRSLVFTQFAEMGHLLQNHLQDVLGREVLYLHGGTPKRRRDAMVERFQEQGEATPPVFVLSLRAGGLGLNLTGANHVFHFDRWWNPAVENQATDRAFRIGQTRNVQVHKFVCAGTLEDRIDAMIESKRRVAEDIVGTGEAWITELSDDELHDMFALRKDAVRD